MKNALTRYKVIYYPKFHFQLNQIKYFWCERKSLTCRHCKYTLDELRDDVLKALKQVKSSTILGNYKSFFKKMDLYQEKVRYGTVK